MLNVVDKDMAVSIIDGALRDWKGAEKLPLPACLGRTAAEDVYSPENLPSFDRSTVDGYAVKASDTFGCSETIPAMLEYQGLIRMGEKVDEVLKKGNCMSIPTGGQLPEGADASVMIEYSDDIGDNFRYIFRPVAPFENVNRKGDDCREGELVLSAGTVIKPRNIAVLAALGISEISVVKPIKVGIISTGDEIVSYTEKPTGSQIRDINSVTLASAVTELGAEALIYPVVPDEWDDLFRILSEANEECDMIILSGGSSVGERDNVSRVLSKLGECMFHGVALKPGKPTMFYMLDDVPVFGLPGHPAAAFFTFHMFVKPAICRMIGREDRNRHVTATLAYKVPSNHGREEIMAVKLSEDEAEPLPAKSGVVSVLSEADGFIVVPRNQEGIQRGEKVEVNLF